MEPQSHANKLNPVAIMEPQSHENKLSKKQQSNLVRVIFKIAQAHRVNPLTQTYETRHFNQFNHLFSHYTTPDHPPYHLMIERAIKELDENGGSSFESISQFLEKDHNKLPLAHLSLLKYHLAKLCESGAIVLTRDSKYMLTGVNNPSWVQNKKTGDKPAGFLVRQSDRECKNQSVGNGLLQNQQIIFGESVCGTSSFQNRVDCEANIVNGFQRDQRPNCMNSFLHNDSQSVEFGRINHESPNPSAPSVLVPNDKQQQIGFAQFKNGTSNFQNIVHGEAVLKNDYQSAGFGRFNHYQSVGFGFLNYKSSDPDVLPPTDKNLGFAQFGHRTASFQNRVHGQADMVNGFLDHQQPDCMDSYLYNDRYQSDGFGYVNPELPNASAPATLVPDQSICENNSVILLKQETYPSKTAGRSEVWAPRM